jgi:transposase InsO family protein
MANMTHNTEVLIATERERWLKLHLEGGLSVRQLGERSGFSRDTLHRWKRLYVRHGIEGLKEKSRAHHHHPMTTKVEIVSRIRFIREAHHFCAEKIRMRLAKEGVVMSTRGIHKVLKREKLVRTKRRMARSDIWRPKSTIPGEVVEVDVALMKRYKGKWVYQFTAIDCCTRWRFLKLYSEQHSFNTASFLRELIKVAPFKVKGVKTDNGSIFTNRYVGAYKSLSTRKKHIFDIVCKQNRIIHYLIQPGKPAQNGKVERSHRTDRDEFWSRTTFSSLKQLREKQQVYIDWYNNEREHLGINGLTPREKIKECQI